jgi:hypothetical protein
MPMEESIFMTLYKQQAPTHHIQDIQDGTHTLTLTVTAG